MKIQKTLYNSKLHEYLVHIHNNRVENIHIPFDIKPKQVSVVPNLLLVFMTAQRLYGISSITISTSSDNEIERFCNSYFGFIILSTFWKSADFIFTSRQVDRSELYIRNKRFHQKLINLNELKMGDALITFFDHLPIKKGLPQLFYNHDDLKSEPELESPLLALLQSISRNRKNEIYPHLSPIIEALMGISWELLSNTHNHARHNEDNTLTLSPNIRGLQCKILSMGYNNLVKYSEGDVALKKYYRRILKENENGLFFEITFFDSGPGIVKRYLGDKYRKNISSKQEAVALSQAIKKGNSSAIGHLKTNKGFGLDRVLNTLSEKKGFLKIRSGSLNVYRDLIDLPYSEGTILLDYTSLSSNQYKKECYLEGTLISLLIPLAEINE